MVDPLLALCALAVCHPIQLKQLVTQAQLYTDWASLPSRAEPQGIAPLAHHHLKEAVNVN
jgi:hypothetical protein